MVPFQRSDILLPQGDIGKWAVIACDQFTSEPEYWEEVKETVGDSPSALHLILPEVYLDKKDDKTIEKINRRMKEYLDGGVFREYKNAYIYLERTLPDGNVRRGIVGEIDLSAYDYKPGSESEIRATEETVLSRIPPRVEIRRGAPIELPHVMLFYDDREDGVNSLIDKEKCVLLYDGELMLGGGYVRGYLLDEPTAREVDARLEKLYSEAKERNKPFLAVGDGNHSLATAAACYAESGGEKAAHTLCEIVNINDSSIEFEPIYRLLTNVNPDEVIEKAKEMFGDNNEGQRVDCYSKEQIDSFYVDGLPAKSLEPLIDFFTERGGTVDYIHGLDSIKELALEDGAIGFVFDGIEKEELFDYVAQYGSLPRKTFSMGEAKSKRYYIEARKIR